MLTPAVAAVRVLLSPVVVGRPRTILVRFGEVTRLRVRWNVPVLVGGTRIPDRRVARQYRLIIVEIVLKIIIVIVQIVGMRQQRRSQR